MFGLNLGATSSSAAAAASPSAYDFENSLRYDGTNDYASLPSNIEVAGSSTEFTLSLWMNPLSNAQSGQFWVFENSNSKDMWFFYGTTTYFRLNGSSGQMVFNYGYDSAGHIGSWHHYVVTRDSSNTIEMYVDAVKQTKSSGTTRTSNLQIQSVGARPSATKNLLGEMDDFIAVGGYCATQQNITDLYNSGAGVDPTTILTSGVVAYWKFNETTGTTASDSSGNGNDLTLNNFTGDYWIPHYPPRIFNNAIFPDGVNDDALTASTLLINSTTDWITSFWIKGSGSSNTTNVIMSKSSVNYKYIFLRKGSTPYIRWQGDGLSNSREDWSDAGLSGWDDGNWHHVYFYRVGNNRHLVFDGVDYGSGGASVAQNGVDLNSFFSRYSTSSLYSNVAMDDVVIHETTGSVAQAQYLYNGGDGADPVAVLGATPKYWYKFDINNGDTTVPNDGTIGSNDLTLSNFSGIYIGSRYFINSLLFDGVNDYVNFTEQTYTSTVFSASFWIKYAAVNSNRIIFGSDSNSNKYFRLDSATQFSVRTRSAGGSIDTWTVPTLSSGQWYHVAISLDNGTNLLWLNGTQYSSNSSVNYANETISIGRIGGRSDGTQMTEGAIDDFIIQSVVLNQTNVDSIYNSGEGSLPTAAFSSSDVYYKFDESSGTSATDSSGNSNTGTLNNFAGTYFILH